MQGVLQDVQLTRLPSIEVEDVETATSMLRDEVEQATSNLKDAVADDRQELMMRLKAAENRLAEVEERAKDSEFRYLSVVDHPPLLADAVKTAQKRLLIISPWISSGVVNGEFLKNLESTLRRGVKVYIGYPPEQSGGGRRPVCTSEARKTGDAPCAAPGQRPQ